MTTRARHGARAIVVGTDFSPSARNAVERAISLTAGGRSTLHVVHASPRLPRALARVFGATSDRKLLAALDEVVVQVRREGVRARAHHIEDGAPKALTRLAREVDAELIVVGARGRALDSFLGSTAERVASISPVPALLVRRPAARSYRRVVVAADTESALADQVAAAKLVAPGATLAVLHAYEGVYESTLVMHGVAPEDIRRYRATARREAHARMVRQLGKAGVDPSCLVLRHGNPFRVIHAADRDELLVLHRGRSTIRRALLGSVTRNVIAHGAADVLLV